MKAEKSNITSRRNALAAIAGAAVAVPTITLAADNVGADSELLSLEAQINDLHAKADEQRDRLDALEPTYKAMCTTVRSLDDKPGYTKWSAWRDDSGYEGHVEAIGDLMEACDPLYERMWAIQPQTNAGRAAQVRTLVKTIMDCPVEDWTSADADLDWNVAMCRRLLYRLADLDPLTGEALAA